MIELSLAVACTALWLGNRISADTLLIVIAIGILTTAIKDGFRSLFNKMRYK